MHHCPARWFCGVFLLSTMAVLVLCAAAISAEADKRLPVPDEKAQAEALKLVMEIYQQRWGAAKTSEQKSKLAREMVEQGKQTAESPVGKYVLLRVAKDMAVEAGDVETALHAVEGIAATFDVDAQGLKTEAFLKAAPSAVLPEHLRAATQCAMPLVQAAVEKNEYEAAGRLVEAARDAARKARDGEFVHRLSELERDIQRIARAYQSIQPALETLRQKPVDPQANLAVGSFLCFVKGDWQRGIPMLALGSDEQLQKLAEKELRGPATPEEHVALADAWWDLAESRPEPEKKSALLHAGACYQNALAKLGAGLLRAKVAKRLEEVAALGEAQTARFDPPQLKTTTRQFALSVKEPWPLSIPVRRGQTLHITASGRWKIMPRGQWHGPGHRQFYLRGRLGDGPEFRIGADFTLEVQESGVLYLGMNEGGDYANNRGGINVVIEITQ